MSKAYSLAEARAHLPDILNEVESGKEVHLTRRGKPVAVALSTDRYELLRSERASFGDAYRAFLVRHSLEEIGVDNDFANSLRDVEVGRRVRV